MLLSGVSTHCPNEPCAEKCMFISFGMMQNLDIICAYALSISITLCLNRLDLCISAVLFYESFENKSVLHQV